MRIVPTDRRQAFLLPPSIDDYVGPRHRVRVIVEVVERLDLSAFDVGESAEGRPAYPPECLVSLLFYAFSIGVFSAREMARRCETDCAFKYATGGLQPSHRTISRFRARYEEELAGLFAQVVSVCRRAGLGDTRQVAVDGTRQRANASLDAHVRKEQAEKELRKIREDMAKLLAEAKRVDAEEDGDPRACQGDDVVPEALQDAKVRREAIETALRELREENPEVAGSQGEVEEGSAPEEARGKVSRRKEEKAQKLERQLRELEERGEKEANETDGDARLQRFRHGGSQPGYNAQIAVSVKDGLILAAEVKQEAGDTGELVPLCDQVERNTGERPEVLVADAGYESGETFRELSERGQDAVVAPAAAKAAEKRRQRTGLYQWVDFEYDADRDEYVCPAGKPLVRVRSGEYRGRSRGVYEGVECEGCPLKSKCTKEARRRLDVLETTPYLLAMLKRYRRDRKGEDLGTKRKIWVESRFGHMKHNLRWRQFMRRGLRACRSEFLILAAALNLSLLARHLAAV